MNRIAIFKTGAHTATSGQTLDATPDFVRAVAASYQPGSHEAPAVIGHPKDNHPAYGWVKSLSFDEGSGTLYADFAQVEPQFEKMLKDGRFKKRSASFYDANHPSNPTPGKPYLRHVGFLGAQPPAVKGLPDHSSGKWSGLKDFKDDSDCAIYEFTEFSTSTTEDKTMPEKTKTPKAPASTGETQDFAEREAKLAADEAALAAREAAIKQREDELAKKAAVEHESRCADFAEGLVKTGQLLPAEKTAVVSVLMDASEDKFLDFAEAGAVVKKNHAEVLKGLLSRLPKQIDFAEHTATDPNGRQLPQNIGGIDED
ncbi:MAG: peptidase, partial [Gammaproteobacteria bacterium]